MYELFLILDAFGDRTQLITYLLEPLTSFAGRPSVVRAHYRDDIDVALIGLSFPAEGREHVARLRQLALRTGIKVIDPSELDDAGRQSFYTQQLASYPVVVEELDLAGALSELTGRVGVMRRRRDETIELGPLGQRRHPSSPGSYRHGRSRDRDADLPTRVSRPPLPLTGAARGTREGLPPPAKQLARGTYSPTVRSVAPRPPRFESPVDVATAPPLHNRPDDRIMVQVSRGDEWIPARLRFLSARRIEVATAATPQVGDPVTLALGFRDCEVTVPGTVDRVSRAPNLSTPVSTGFSVTMSNLTAPVQAALLELLQRASDAGIRLTPPALRPARFAVSWPLIVCPEGGEPVRVTALDVSLGGMFLRQRSLGTELAFALPIDEVRAPAIRGRLQVVREMGPDVADQLGFTPGSGVAVRGFAVNDRERYERFIARIRERNDRRLVVAASPERLGLLVPGLRGVGYSVTSSSDPAEVVELANSRLRPDVAIVDHSLTGFASETDLLLSILREHHVFTLATTGEHVEETRRAVDELLGI